MADSPGKNGEFIQKKIMHIAFVALYFAHLDVHSWEGNNSLHIGGQAGWSPSDPIDLLLGRYPPRLGADLGHLGCKRLKVGDPAMF